jgi:hypothetical protein
MRRGLYRRDPLRGGHIVPPNIRPQSNNVLANLKRMPARMNSSKNGRVGRSQGSMRDDARFDGCDDG